jgi:iron complex outermembrane receptor protein
MKTSTRYTPLTLLCSGVAALTTHAAESPPATTELPKIIVQEAVDSDYVAPTASTATKTDTPLIETPMSIIVIPQQVLQDQQALTLDRVLANVRGVKSGGGEGGQESITLRGFFTTTTFVNGFRLEEYSTTGGGTLGATSLTNVDRVEVLLGPAAILYGRVEPGGMVNIMTKQPETQFSAAVQQLVGSWNHFVTSADLNAALNADKTLLFRVNASYDTADSWRDTVYARVSFVAPVLAWQITPRTRLSLEGEFRRSVANQDVGQVIPLDPVTSDYVWIGRTSTITSNEGKTDTSRYFETLSHAFGEDWAVTQKYMHALTVVPRGASDYPADMYQQNGQWFADRYVSAVGSINKTDAGIIDLVGHFKTAAIRHTLLVGADYYRTEVNFTFGFGSNAIPTPIIDPVPDDLTPDPNSFMYLPQVSRNYGIYIQDQLKIADSVDVVLGERYQHFQTDSGFAMPPDSAVIPNPTVTDHALTPHAGVLWLPRRNLGVYASYSTNFGSNNGFDFAGKPLDPESGKQYEVGAKLEMLDSKLTASAAWFDLRKTHVAVPDRLHPNFSVTVGEIRSRGVEADLQGEVLPGWNVLTNLTYDPTLVTKGGPVGSNYVEGDPLSGDTKWMANLWTTYRCSGGALAGWKFGFGANWRDGEEYPRARVDGTSLTTPSYWVASAMAAYERPIGTAKLSLQVNVDNLFNTFYFNNLYPVAPANYTFLNYGTPRSLAAAVKVAF